MSYTILTKGLIKRFGKVKALAGLDLKAVRGVSGFIGPNGAGKTTTIRILLGLLKADSGEASVLGLDCWKDSFKIKERVGVLNEKPKYPGSFKASKFLERVARLYGVPDPRGRSRELLKDVGLSNAADREIRTYSAGMVQRLGLAQALVGSPELVILDEPTANLDPLGRMEFLEKIKTFSRDLSISFLISTHILPELEKVCGWVSIINKGVIRDQGYVASLAQKYSAKVYKVVASNPSLLFNMLHRSSVVEELRVEDESIYVKVKDHDSFYNELASITHSFNIQLKELKPACGTLEEIFKEAMKYEA